MQKTSDHRLKASYFPALTTADALEHARSQAAWYLAPLKDTLSVTFPKTDTEASHLAERADVIFFWQKASFWAAKASLRRKGLVVDEYAEQAVGDKLDAFIANHISEEAPTDPAQFFAALNAKCPNISAAILIGSAPTLTTLKNVPQDSLTSAVKIYLSSAILNADICSLSPPDIIIAVDGPSQFGPSETAQHYRKRAVDLIRKHKSLVLIPAQHLPSVRAHWPEDIQDQIFAVPLVRQAGQGHRLKNNWHYEPTSNALTSFGLPCAASISDNIYFAGISVDVPKQDGQAHWQHIDEPRYQRHVAPMLARHPASGQDTTHYVAQHHARLKTELAAYASAGISFATFHDGSLSIDPQLSSGTVSNRLPLKVKIFEAIARAQHYPRPVILTSFILAGLLGAALQYSIGLRMTGFLIAGALAAFLMAGLLFLRLRMNRMSARLETKLSQQQAQQFANLSERLAALERKK